MANNGTITITIQGLPELERKLSGLRADGPINRFLDRGAIFIQGQARVLAPVDTGRLRNSIGVKDNYREREIGPNATYAPYVEFGTRPHFVSAANIGPWAGRHGMDRNKGLIVSGRAQPFMKPGAEAAVPFIKGLVPTLAAEIESAYQS